MVARDAIHILRGERDAAEDIAAAHHHADLHAFAGHGGDFIGQVAHAVRIEAERLRAGHGFAAEFEENAFVFRHAELILADAAHFLAHGAVNSAFTRRLPADPEFRRRL